MATCSAAFAQETSPTLEVVGHLPLRGPRGDVWAHKNFAYVGNWGDTTGVAIIDIADPKNPVLVGNLPAKSNTSYEDLHVITADTPTFKGDLLIVGVQRQNAGAEFWDVTDPRQPKLLSFFRTGGNHVHELYLVQRGERVLALLATLDSGMRIVDATDPTQPKQLSLWNLQREMKINPVLGVNRAVFDHSVSANADGTRAYLAYWDAGAVILDISDPAAPKYLGRTAYALTEEGQTHSAIEADGGRLLITTDEDSDPSPAANTITVIGPESLAGLHQAIELSVTRQLATTGPVRGELVYIGTATAGVDFLSDPKGKIALIDVTSETTQPRSPVLRAQEAGAIGVVVSRTPFRSSAPSSAITIPGVGVARETAEALKTALAAGQKVELELKTAPGSFGFVRIWDIRDPAKPVQISTFATPRTREFPVKDGNTFPWAYTAHNPVVRGTRLYASWYGDGVRLIDIANPAEPKEIAHFIPPFLDGSRLTPGLGTKFAVVWGVVEHNGLLLLSDMQTGLWILRDLPR
jgi:hypothetical protein